MFMRYFGGGIGHMTEGSRWQSADEIDVGDVESEESGGNLQDVDGTLHSSKFGADCMKDDNSDSNSPDRGSDDSGESSDESDSEDSDSDDGSDNDSDNDLGGEDGDDIDGDNGYGRL
jgi:hypothetical protein